MVANIAAPGSIQYNDAKVRGIILYYFCHFFIYSLTLHL